MNLVLFVLLTTIRHSASLSTLTRMEIKSLHRYAVKGLSGDSLSSVTLNPGDGTFEDDRRFALLYDSSSGKFDDSDPNWLHKENFLCAFTAPELLASLNTQYTITQDDNSNKVQRLLTVWDRASNQWSSKPLLGPIDLSSPSGRDETSDFFTKLCGRKVICVVANDNNNRNGVLNQQHTHQFGNTSSGVKHNHGDTRTLHIVNENTVRQFSNAVYGNDGRGSKSTTPFLSATRFRPNIVIGNFEPWGEFNLVGKTIELVSKNRGNNCISGDYPLRLRIVSKTVRCAGVGMDPLHPEQGNLDIPKLLVEHFPEHGPYFGVYAVVDGTSCGTISVGDHFCAV